MAKFSAQGLLRLKSMCGWLDSCLENSGEVSASSLIQEVDRIQFLLALGLGAPFLAVCHPETTLVLEAACFSAHMMPSIIKQHIVSFLGFKGIHA